MKNINILLFALLIFVVSCKKNLDDSLVIDPPIPPLIGNNYEPIVEPITSSVLGIVVDENGQIVEGATISLGNQTQISDAFGSFQFVNETMNKNGTFLEVEKAGYFLTGRRFYPKSSATNNVRIELLEKIFDQSFESSAGGTITFENGGEINFPPNSIKKEDGSTYLGEVRVAVKWLDPTAFATFDQMPGSLQGVTIQGDEMALETYGMIAVELESTTGESLNILESQTAVIKMPVPQSILNNAPDEIPLWSFNYDYGIWAEDGKALLQNGFYVGEVSHFSFWNCDYPRPVVELSMTIKDINNQSPLRNTKVVLTILNGGNTSSGTTDANGIVTGQIPLGEELEVQVLNSCNDIVLSQSIGSFTTNSVLELEVNIGDAFILSGELIDCDGVSITDGIILVNMDGNISHIPVNTNPFELKIPICQNATSISVSGGNYTDFQQGDFITFPITDSVNVGDLIACGSNLVGFAVITLDSTTTEIVGDLHMSSSNDYIYTGSPGNDILISFLNIAVGDFSTTHSNEEFYISNLNLVTYTEFEYFEIFTYGENPGDLISGKCFGNVQNWWGGQTQTAHMSMEFSFYKD